MTKKAGTRFQVLHLHMVVVHWSSQCKVQKDLDASKGGHHQAKKTQTKIKVSQSKKGAKSATWCILRQLGMHWPAQIEPNAAQPVVQIFGAKKCDILQ